MNFGRYTQQQLAGSRLLRVYTLLLAVRQIVFDCKLELSPQFGNRFAMKADDVANAGNTAHENIVTLVILDASGNATFLPVAVTHDQKPWRRAQRV